MRRTIIVISMVAAVSVFLFGCRSTMPHEFYRLTQGAATQSFGVRAFSGIGSVDQMTPPLVTEADVESVSFRVDEENASLGLRILLKEENRRSISHQSRKILPSSKFFAYVLDKRLVMAWAPREIEREIYVCPIPFNVALTLEQRFMAQGWMRAPEVVAAQFTLDTLKGVGSPTQFTKGDDQEKIDRR